METTFNRYIAGRRFSAAKSCAIISRKQEKPTADRDYFWRFSTPCGEETTSRGGADENAAEFGRFDALNGPRR
ncbi:MAG: hypothetical protein PHO46_09885 [Thermoguttaceae bacterium]|nr:hypothetical protein [Thermoguttaceae bacterium]